MDFFGDLCLVLPALRAPYSPVFGGCLHRVAGLVSVARPPGSQFSRIVRARIPLIAAVLLVATAAFLPSTPASGQTLDELRTQVAEAKAAANEAAAKYTEAQSMFEQLGDEIEAAEASIAQHEAEAAALQAMAEHRAVTAYTGHDVSFPVELDDNDVLDAARRTELLERVNARDNDAVDALAAITEDLEAQREELAEAQ
jgi:hypothetical protein